MDTSPRLSRTMGTNSARLRLFIRGPGSLHVPCELPVPKYRVMSLEAPGVCHFAAPGLLFDVGFRSGL
jgi:hypothetical protein